MPATAPHDTLGQLRRVVAKIDPSPVFGEEAASLGLGVPAVDAALAGGIALGALHEVAPARPAQFGAAFGFALVLAALSASGGGRRTLLVQTEFAAREAGVPYGPGVDLLGLSMERLLLLRVPRPLDVLWAFEEALKSPAIAAVLAELPTAGAGGAGGAAADLTATRRLSLAARAGGGIGLLLRHRASPLPAAAMTRWEVAAAPGMPDAFGGLGRTGFDLSLRRNRRGRCGRFIVCWDHHECCFLPEALSLGVAETARDRSDDARPLVRAG
jgi:protein ImuA